MQPILFFKNYMGPPDARCGARRGMTERGWVLQLEEVTYARPELWQDVDGQDDWTAGTPAVMNPPP